MENLLITFSTALNFMAQATQENMPNMDMMDYMSGLDIGGNTHYSPLYFIMHILGIGLVLFSIGGAVFGSFLKTPGLPKSWRSSIFIMSGIGMVLILVGGFGMLAYIGMANMMSVWVWGKISIWLVLGILPGLILRRTNLRTPLTVLTFVLVFIALVLVSYKI